MMDQEDEFPINKDRWKSVKERTKSIQENYGVRVEQGAHDTVSRTQWVKLIGKEETCKLAKEYIKALCNPTEVVPMRYPHELHDILTNLAIMSKLEKQCNVVILNKKRGELYICGTDPTPVTMAMSAIEDLITKYHANGAVDLCKKESAAFTKILQKCGDDTGQLQSLEFASIPAAVKDTIIGWFEQDNPSKIWYETGLGQATTEQEAQPHPEPVKQNMTAAQGFCVSTGDGDNLLAALSNNNFGNGSQFGDHNEIKNVKSVTEKFGETNIKEVKGIQHFPTSEFFRESPTPAKSVKRNSPSEIYQSNVGEAKQGQRNSVNEFSHMSPANGFSQNRSPAHMTGISNPEMLRRQAKEKNYTDEEVDIVFQSLGTDFEIRAFIRALFNNRRLKKKSAAAKQLATANPMEPSANGPPVSSNIISLNKPLASEAGMDMNHLSKVDQKPVGDMLLGGNASLSSQIKRTTSSPQLDPYYQKLMGDFHAEVEGTDINQLKENNRSRLNLLQDIMNTQDKEERQRRFKEAFMAEQHTTESTDKKNGRGPPGVKKAERYDTGTENSAALVSIHRAPHDEGKLMDTLDSISLPSQSKPQPTRTQSPLARTHSPRQQKKSDPIPFTGRKPSASHHSSSPNSNHSPKQHRHHSPRQHTNSPHRGRQYHHSPSPGPRNKPWREGQNAVNYQQLAPVGAVGFDPSGNTELRHIVIDGSNVAMAHGNQKCFSCRGIELCIDFFLKRGHTQVTAFVPQTRQRMHHHTNPISDQHLLEELREKGYVSFTPARRVAGKTVSCHDDWFVLNLAQQTDGIIVSNDNYRDHYAEKPEWQDLIAKRILMFTFVGDIFMPPDDPLGKNGPTLADFLRVSKVSSGSTMQIPDQRNNMQLLPAYPRHAGTQQNIPWVVPQTNPDARGHQRKQQRPSSQLRPPQVTEQLKKDLLNIFADSEELINRILENHAEESDLNKLSNYLVEVLYT